MKAACIAYRSALRRALAEMTILKIEAEARIVAERCKANQGRRTRATAFHVACKRINELLVGPCVCGEEHFAIKRRATSYSTKFGQRHRRRLRRQAPEVGA